MATNIELPPDGARGHADGEEADELETFGSPAVLKAIRHIKNYVSSLLGLPYCSDSYVAQTVLKLAHIERAELLEYQKSARANRMTHLAWVLLVSSALFCLKSSLMPVVMLGELDFKEPSVNIIPLGGRLYRFACFISNCTHYPAAVISGEHSNFNRPPQCQPDERQPELDELDRGQLKELGAALLLLPHFSLCHPWMAPLLEPIKDLNVLGMVLISAAAYFVLLSGLAFPLARFAVSSSSNSLVMFLAAPRAGRQLLIERALALSRQLRDSLACFKRTRVQLEMARRAHSKALRAQPIARVHQNAAGTRDEVALKPEPAGDSEAFARDCVTLMRSDWWHRQAIKSFINLWVLVWLAVCSSPVLMPLALDHILLPRQATLQRMGELMERCHCNLWLTSGPRASDHLKGKTFDGLANVSLSSALDVGQLEVTRVNWWLVGLYMVQVFWPILSVYLFLIAYMLVVTELVCWLAEFRFQLALAIQLIKQLEPASGANRALGQPLPPSLPPPDNERPLQGLSMRTLRNRFSQMTSIEFGLFWMQQMSNRESALANERFAAEVIESEHLKAGAPAGELLEKLYVDFRIFVEHVQSYESNMSVAMLIVNAFVYGFIAINMFYMRASDQFVQVPVALNVIGFSACQLVIIFTSNFHAKANKLQPLLCSLIAETSASTDSRVQHMRALWLKQVEALDSGGGLALRAYGIRITYLFVTQLVIALGTLAVYILRES